MSRATTLLWIQDFHLNNKTILTLCTFVLTKKILLHITSFNCACLSVYLFLSLTFFVCLYVCLSVSVFLSLSVSVSVCLSVSPLSLESLTLPGLTLLHCPALPLICFFSHTDSQQIRNCVIFLFLGLEIT